jgi:acetylglutamate kinase
MNRSDILVAKIGGSTLGSHDTTLQDLVELQRRGLRPVVVHGGGATISEWLDRHNVPTRFQRGLRVTDAEALKVVVAVLAGLVNTELVASLQAMGGRAAGISGADGGLLRARLLDQQLGFVGEIMEVDTGPLRLLINDGSIPVIAPIAVRWDGGRPTGQLLNVNADTVAGAVAAALGAGRLAFLTDVPGVRSEEGDTLKRVSRADAERLKETEVIEGGMIPKVEACLTAGDEGCASVVLDGRTEGALLSLVEGETRGTAVG